MDADTGSFRHGSATLHYTRQGHGPRILLAFHGFGQSATALTAICQQLAHSHTIYIFDLFFHGKSVWHNRGQTLTNAHWRDLMEAFLTAHRITRCDVLGFSIGGKLATSLVHSLPQYIEQLYLVAPDGLRPNWWYRLATGTPHMRALLRYIIFRPGMFLRLVSLFGSWGLVNRSMTRFVTSQMNSRVKRWRVYNTWITLREVGISDRQMAEVLNRHGIATQVLLGKYDHVITPRSLGRLPRLAPHINLHVLPAGHSNLLDQAARHLGTAQPKAIPA